MFCKHCGKQLKEGAQFCQYCGRKVTVLGVAAPKQGAVQPAGDSVESKSQQPISHTVTASEKPPKKAGAPKGMIVGIVLAILVLIIGVVIFVFGLGRDKRTEDADVDPISEYEDRKEETPDESLDEPESDPEPEPEDSVPEETQESQSAESQTPDPTIEPTTEPQEISDSQYILPASNTEYFTMDDLQGLTKEDCRIARNELYARHGRRFDDAELQAHFDACDWYTGTIAPADFDDSVLNEYEIANRDLIVQYETDMGYR